MMKRMITNAKSSRLASFMGYKDYMPYHNEHCTVGTTYDAMVNGENKADSVCVSKKAIDTDFMWENSSANSKISDVFEETESSEGSMYADKPSTAHFQSKAPPLREGLFKSSKKQTFKRLP
ncbi:unnamed protein product [Absidia cylindrospora]